MQINQPYTLKIKTILVGTVLSACLSIVGCLAMSGDKQDAQNQPKSRSAIDDTRSYIELSMDGLEEAPSDIIRGWYQAQSALQLYQEGQRIFPHIFYAQIILNDEKTAYFLVFTWLDDGNTVPQIKLFDKNGRIVGSMDSRPYGDLPNTLIRSQMLMLLGPGKFQASNHIDMPKLNISVPPSDIEGLYMIQNDYVSYSEVSP